MSRRQKRWLLSDVTFLTLIFFWGTSSYAASNTHIYDSLNRLIEMRAEQNGGQQGCENTITPGIQSFNALGGSGNVGVSAASGCAWSAVSNATWITITSGGSGSGNGTVGFNVAANSEAGSRTGTMSIAGRTFVVNQAGSANCAYAITSNTQSFNELGGEGIISVTATTGCAWTGVSNAPWIAIFSNEANSGSGTLSFSVGENEGTNSRTGTITVAGLTFTVNQNGTSCRNQIIRIARTGQTYATLQAAYDAAIDNDVIQVQGVKLINNNLVANRNISAKLEGGYDCAFTTNSGGITWLKGMIQTTGGGGSLAIENFALNSDITGPATTASTSGGTYNNVLSVMLSCYDESGSGCYKIYYTTDGSTPTISSAVYSSPINISSTTTIKFFAQDLAGNSESIKTQTYTVDLSPPLTTASPTGGTYNSTQSVILSCSDGSGTGCDKIYYTTDGSTPTTSSSIYSSPINILTPTTLKFFAQDLAGNSESVKAQTYNIIGMTPVRISGSTPRYFNSIQEAYDAAVNGDIIQTQATTFTANLNINRNISVSLKGGYNADYTTNTGNVTNLKGTIQTTPGGGTLTVENLLTTN